MKKDLNYIYTTIIFFGRNYEHTQMIHDMRQVVVRQYLDSLISLIPDGSFAWCLQTNLGECDILPSGRIRLVRKLAHLFLVKGHVLITLETITCTLVYTGTWHMFSAHCI